LAGPLGDLLTHNRPASGTMAMHWRWSGCDPLVTTYLA